MKQGLKFIVRSPLIAQRVCAAISQLPHEEPYEVVIRKHRAKRSLDQNALHWRRLDVIRLHIADSTGQIFSSEELHEFFKGKFLPARLVEVGGESVNVRRTTTKMNTKEFSDFMEQIDQYCVDRLHLYLPQPGEIE